MEIKEYKYGDVRVYAGAISQEGRQKREQERMAETAMLKQILGEGVTLEHDEKGKPYLRGSETNISISHSNHVLCFALSESEPAGIDVEELHPRLERVSSMFLKPDELALLEGGGIPALAVCWSAKEAVYKLAGEAAGAMAEHVELDIQGVRNALKGNGESFAATVRGERYRLTIIELNEEYEIVLACKYITK